MKSRATQTDEPKTTVAQTETGRGSIKIRHLPKVLRERVQSRRDGREKEKKRLEKIRKIEKTKLAREAERKKMAKAKKTGPSRAEPRTPPTASRTSASKNQKLGGYSALVGRHVNLF